MSERPECFYCGALVSGNGRGDHFPIPRNAGGTDTVPCCESCHDMKDRFALEAWPVEWIGKVIADFPNLSRETRLFLARVLRRVSESTDEIERLGSLVEKFQKIVENYDRDRIEYCDAWMKWIKDHDALDVMEWMMAYANAIPAPNPDGDAPTEIYAAIDARSREASIEIERLRTRVSELEDVVAGRRPVL